MKKEEARKTLGQFVLQIRDQMTDYAGNQKSLADQAAGAAMLAVMLGIITIEEGSRLMQNTDEVAARVEKLYFSRFDAVALEAVQY